MAGSNTTSVVTYRLAYVQGGEVSLCSRHAGTDLHEPIADVSHGEHDGICDVCADEEIAAERSRRKILLSLRATETRPGSWAAVGRHPSGAPGSACSALVRNASRGLNVVAFESIEQARQTHEVWGSRVECENAIYDKLKAAGIRS